MTAIKLADDREISLNTFHQYYTYGGLLEGRPDEGVNNGIVDRAVEFAAETHVLSFSAPVVLIPPKIEHKPTGLTGQRAKSWHKKTGSNVTPPLFYPALPSIICIAQFKSGERTGHTNEIWSHLCIVWFQPEFGLPIDADIKREIQDIAWDKLAVGFDP